MPHNDEALFKNGETMCCVESKRNDDTYTNDVSTNFIIQEIIKEPTAADIQSNCKEHFKISATNDFCQASTDNYFKRDCKYDDYLKPKTEDYFEPRSCDYCKPLPTDYLKSECKYFLQTLREDSSHHRHDNYLQTIKEEVHSKLYNYTQSKINYDLEQQNINDNLIQSRIDDDYHQLHGRNEINCHTKSDPTENNQVIRNENIDDYCTLFPSNKIDDMSLTVINYYIIHKFLIKSYNKIQYKLRVKKNYIT